MAPSYDEVFAALTRPGGAFEIETETVPGLPMKVFAKRRGDRLAALSTNTPGWLIALFAATSAGGVAEIENLLRGSGAVPFDAPRLG